MFNWELEELMTSKGFLTKCFMGLFDHPEVYVVLGESMLGERLEFHP